MEELIQKKKLIADLKGVKDMLTAAGDPFLASVINRAITCVENQPVIVPAESGLVSDDKEFAKAIKYLEEKYAKAKTLDYVYNNIGWALHQTLRRFE